MCAAIYPAFMLSRQYAASRVQGISQRDRAIFAQLEAHQKSLVFLDDSQKAMSTLAADKISTASMSQIYADLRIAFAQGEYEKASSLSAALAEKIGTAREDDTKLAAEFSKKIADITKKRDDYKKLGVNVATVSSSLASASAQLSEKSYDTLPSLLTLLDTSLNSLLAQKKEADKKAALAAASAATVTAISPQSVGGVTYERKTIGTSIGSYSVDLLTVDLNRIKVKTFTASENDCATNCPLKPLASYVSENGGVAGINGTYFCPADYDSCSRKVNAFDLLVFDYRTKKYLNSAQNQYSVNPLISFYGDGAHYYTQALGFGRDTSANGVISNFPTLIHNGGVAMQVNLDAKSAGTKTMRGGIGFRGKTLWAVMTRGATVPESAYVFQALGAEYAMNLDGGGSAALYFGGYKVGPGRNLPNAVVFTN